jgi:hypothetical protein
MQKKFTIIFLISLLALTPLAHATDGEGISLTDFPQALADFFGLTLFQGQILAAILMLSFVIFPLLVFTKGKNMPLTVIIGIAVFTFDVALGWFPPWGFAVIIITVAVMAGDKIIGKL